MKPKALKAERTQMKAVKPTTDNWKVSKYNEKWTISQQKIAKINIAGCGSRVHTQVFAKSLLSYGKYFAYFACSPAFPWRRSECVHVLCVSVCLCLCACVSLCVHEYVWNPTKRKAKTQQFSNTFTSFWNSISQRVRNNNKNKSNNNSLTKFNHAAVYMCCYAPTACFIYAYKCVCIYLSILMYMHMYILYFAGILYMPSFYHQLNSASHQRGKLKDYEHQVRKWCIGPARLQKRQHHTTNTCLKRPHRQSHTHTHTTTAYT